MLAGIVGFENDADPPAEGLRTLAVHVLPPPGVMSSRLSRTALAERAPGFLQGRRALDRSDGEESAAVQRVVVVDGDVRAPDRA